MLDTAAGQRRIAAEERRTAETQIRARVDLDGSGMSHVSTGIRMLDHLLDQFARHSLIDVEIEASGDLDVDAHHTVEDTGICLGRALHVALGERRGVRRMADRTVPLDEALVQVALDLSGRPFAAVDLPFHGERVGSLPTEMIEHFLSTFATEARLTLHVRTLAGKNDHHLAEAAFKALARALGDAVSIDPRLGHAPASTKGTLTG